MKTFLARLAIAGAGEPDSNSPADVAFEIYTAWLHHVLALVDQDRMQGYSGFTSTLTPRAQETFRTLSAEDQKDRVFDTLLNDTSALLTFAEPLLTQTSNPQTVISELTKYIRITPDGTPL